MQHEIFEVLSFLHDFCMKILCISFVWFCAIYTWKWHQFIYSRKHENMSWKFMQNSPKSWTTCMNHYNIDIYYIVYNLELRLFRCFIRCGIYKGHHMDFNSCEYLTKNSCKASHKNVGTIYMCVLFSAFLKIWYKIPEFFFMILMCGTFICIQLAK